MSEKKVERKKYMSFYLAIFKWKLRGCFALNFFTDLQIFYLFMFLNCASLKKLWIYLYLKGYVLPLVFLWTTLQRSSFGQKFSFKKTNGINIIGIIFRQKITQKRIEIQICFFILIALETWKKAKFEGSEEMWSCSFGQMANLVVSIFDALIEHVSIWEKFSFSDWKSVGVSNLQTEIFTRHLKKINAFCWAGK